MKHLQSLDRVDRRLLELLRQDARRTNASLAEELGVAPSTCLARLKALRASGAVRGFTVEVDPAALGNGLVALISVRIRPGARHRMEELFEQMRALPGVLQVFFLGGEEDFLLHVAVADSEEVSRFVLKNLSADPAVASTRTSLVFRHEHGERPWQRG
ncbi:Lrp/AsnC family transcriptional regulator [Micrococcus sp. 2A]|uniref:Lrp/AsnC family transcriptional regulator n=1 Tax=Micrococcus sp. 2A TaxID=3142261 RepID=UPI0026280881|nr:Lrp/AsnC family transcriptional regulator [uncultured Micrococcus sp.]